MSMKRTPAIITILTAMLLPAGVIPAQAADVTALDMLDTLIVEPQSDSYDSDRDRPKDWTEIDSEHGPDYDTRDMILARDLTDVTWNEDGHVITGTLRDPYTGKTIDFKRTNYDGQGGGYSNSIQIDHVVAFGEAWESGLDSQGKDAAERFYDDPYVLLAVDGPTNASKNDSDAAEWLPSTRTGDTSYDCWYVARQIGIKARYGLSVDEAEKQAMQDTLATCPAMTIPTDDGAYWQYDDNDDNAPVYSTDDLTGLTVIVDGKPYAGFDPATGSYQLPDGDHVVDIAGTPDGWTMTPATQTVQTITPDGDVMTSVEASFTFTAPDSTTVASYTFTWDGTEHADDGETSETPTVPDDPSDDATGDMAPPTANDATPGEAPADANADTGSPDETATERQVDDARHETGTLAQTGVGISGMLLAAGILFATGGLAWSMRREHR